MRTKEEIEERIKIYKKDALPGGLYNLLITELKWVLKELGFGDSEIRKVDGKTKRCLPLNKDHLNLLYKRYGVTMVTMVTVTPSEDQSSNNNVINVNKGSRNHRNHRNFVTNCAVSDERISTNNELSDDQLVNMIAGYKQGYDAVEFVDAYVED